jgi:hypothetical protein
VGTFLHRDAILCKVDTFLHRDEVVRKMDTLLHRDPLNTKPGLYVLVSKCFPLTYLAILTFSSCLK